MARGAVGVARRLGVAEPLIGLTPVGFGTSTPELLTSVNAAPAGSPGSSIGNVVGSITHNALGIPGVAADIAPVSFPADMVARDWIALVGAAVLLVFHAWTGARVSRWEGWFLLTLYAAYCVALFQIR